MPEIKLTSEELRYMSLFQDVTRVTARDCIVDEENNRIIFLVNPENMGTAIGKNGSNVKRLEKLIGKSIEIVGYSDNLEDLVRNLMAPAKVRSVKVVQSNSKKTVYINVDPQDKGLAIGKNGRNVTRAKLILKRYMDIDSVIIT
ncbi:MULTISPECIES: NusA-like transcription termination signal-binding factor [Sulfolobaceae]|uniref:Probable transcription termination protein NusA n=3 Tax=Sulfurisphaera TaxID=69655 RepID=F9VMS0_SULTO|nr:MULTISPECIES: NusA-like transcription termination signal-binding factor [Sulfolobaceae]MBB5253188.1 N utilization substance protein A [Sulfurisphaera ohwakuensis]QGR15900.1 NusA-like transcription termination signal-binding factor [Sulfurisphaera ohwakuensis]QIW23106.1 NusA-like transcription termination signal-binding factor [Sulfolobus sp. S-194]BAK54216.1 putative transcription termination factor NusA [Sulfurisphaera tokodaii str. 7]HII75059.1 NusA-like transcription termination signal-b